MLVYFRQRPRRAWSRRCRELFRRHGSDRAPALADRRRHDPAGRRSGSLLRGSSRTRSARRAVIVVTLAVGGRRDARCRAARAPSSGRPRISTLGRGVRARRRAGAGARAGRLALGRDDHDGPVPRASTREAAARFSFLLGVPAMFAAAAHEGQTAARRCRWTRVTTQVFLVGIVVSAVVGYVDRQVFPAVSGVAHARRVRVVPHRAGRRHAGLAARCEAGLNAVMIHWLRRRFITGFFVTVPLIISVAALVWIFRRRRRLHGADLRAPARARRARPRAAHDGGRRAARRRRGDQRDRPAAAAARRALAAARAGVQDRLRAGQAAGRGVLARQRVGFKQVVLVEDAASAAT